jgi:hypothetical protein
LKDIRWAIPPNENPDGFARAVREPPLRGLKISDSLKP